MAPAVVWKPVFEISKPFLILAYNKSNARALNSFELSLRAKAKQSDEVVARAKPVSARRNGHPSRNLFAG
jgi:hypothetical protein